MLCVGHGPKYYFENLKYIKRRLKVKFKRIPIYKLHKFWYTTSYHSPLLGTIQFGVCKSSVSDMGPNTILKIKKCIKRRLKSEI